MGGKSLKDLASASNANADRDGDESVYTDDESVDGEGDESNNKRVSIFVLHPSNKFRQAWDMCQVGILAYLAFTVPYRVGFREPAYGIWYIVEFFVDIYFWAGPGFFSPFPRV